MRNLFGWARFVLACVALLGYGYGEAVLAQQGASADTTNSIEDIQVSQLGGNTLMKVTLRQPLATLPANFSIANPARMVFDFPATSNGLNRSVQQLNEGLLRSVNIVQVGDRTRLVANVQRVVPIESRLEGKSLVITFQQSAPVEAAAGGATVTHFAEPKARDAGHGIRDIGFKRGKNGEALIVVELSDANVGIDLRQQGSTLLVDFLNVSLPEHLRRRLDVTDFATPVTHVNTVVQGENARISIAPRGLWEHNAYQSDNQFVIEVKPVIEDPNKLVQGTRGGYQGEKLSLSIQDLSVRETLNIISDFTGFNLVVSDSVTGNLTLRLKDVPWDQALDIILGARGLDMRKNGNVIWIAPRDELAAKDKQVLDSQQQLSELEPTRTESFQLNYQKAEAVKTLLGGGADKDKGASQLLSKRASVTVDARTNKLFVSDTPQKLDDVRKLIKEIDVPVRQVLIEARIVEATDTFSKSLGTRLGVVDLNTAGHPLSGSGMRYSVNSSMNTVGYVTGQTDKVPTFSTDAQAVNLPASATGGSQPGMLSFSLFNTSRTQFLNLELSALEADGKGKIISSPRIVTADQEKARIEQGTELPYQQASASGATAVAFKKANLALEVTPQITPDGRVIMKLDITKDSPNTSISMAAGIAIDTKHISTNVLVENGGTVVIGGIYSQENSETVNRIPVLGDVPYVGFLFRKKDKKESKSELLVFITPKIVDDKLSVR